MDVFRKNPFQKIDFGERLSRARIQLRLSQEALAEAVGTTARSISRWEHNQAIPQLYYREHLCKVLQTTPEVLFADENEERQNLAQSAPLWHIPYTRNQYFTGREEVLDQLYATLHADQHTALPQLHILSGLGGIGKTQTALEYAYRFHDDYETVVWVDATTSETLLAGYLSLAQLFHVPAKDEADPLSLREAVKHWFRHHTNWLLLFDDVRDPELLNTLLPDMGQGSILITTRSQIMGTLGYQTNLQKMRQDEGMLFLLRRAKLLHPHSSTPKVSALVRAQAETLVDILDGLPLALDQAGAYIEETSCSLSDYLERYATRRQVMLSYRGAVSSHHPAAVSATLIQAVQQVEQISPLAANLLRLCAFLHHEAIPEELILRIGDASGGPIPLCSTDPLLLDTAIRELRRFSLLHREAVQRTFSIHRLVQVSVRESIGEHARARWIERLLPVLLQVFPNDIALYTHGLSSLYLDYLPHMLACASALKEWGLVSLKIGELFYRVAIFLQLQGDTAQAISWLLQALHMTRKILGAEHETVTHYASELARFYIDTRQYEQAEIYSRQTFSLTASTT